MRRQAWSFTYQLILKSQHPALKESPTIEAAGEAGNLYFASRRSLHGQGTLGQDVVHKGVPIEDDEPLPAREEGDDRRVGFVADHPHEFFREGRFGWFGLLGFLLLVLLLPFWRGRGDDTLGDREVGSG